MRTIKTTEADNVSGHIEQGNIRINCEDYGLPSIFVKSPKVAPLSQVEPAAKVRIVGVNYDFHVVLNSKQLDALEGAIHKTQEHLMESRE